MSTEEIRAAIVAKAEAPLGAGVMQRYQRYFRRRDADFEQAYTKDGRLFAWFVSRTAVREEELDTEQSRVVTTWRMDGMMTIEDADETEILFDAFVDALRAAFRGDETLGGTVSTINVDGRLGPQVVSSGPAEFAGALVHHARFELVTEHLADVGDASALDDFLTFHADWDIAGGADAAEPLPAAESDAEDTVTLPGPQEE